MSFPYHDRFWCDAADFLEKRAARDDAILAPDIFWWRFRKMYRYINPRLRALDVLDRRKPQERRRNSVMTAHMLEASREFADWRRNYFVANDPRSRAASSRLCCLI
jgi:hypothetical protein